MAVDCERKKKKWYALFYLHGERYWISAPSQRELNTKIFGAASAPLYNQVTYYVEQDQENEN